ncbi:MAG: DmsE family decaheme c-type cytochrome [Betaproteobacteria bacterium]|nr:DmsE family decaheme c-type cytochrome [Betaproteobacteria bacterium]
MRLTVGWCWQKVALAWMCAIAGIASSTAWAAETAAARVVAPEAEICKGCHEKYVESYLTTKHGQQGNRSGPDCQTCHANATEHAKAGGGRGVGGVLGFNNKKIAAEKKAAVCLSCHVGNRHLAFWTAGRHAKNDVACNDCHSLHSKPGPGSTIALKHPNPSISPFQTTQRQLEYETCTTCHKQIRSQLTKTSHHPIIEGKVRCSDCHNPHGALSPGMVKNESVNQLCTSCHADKRGPFMWEHPPVEENCMSCHNSHGSSHTKLLNEKVPQLCQDCHDWSQHPGTAYQGNLGFGGAANTRFVARSCVNCHQEIHGSNAGSARGKRFTR